MSDDDDDDQGLVLEGSVNSRLSNLDKAIGAVQTPTNVEKVKAGGATSTTTDTKGVMAQPSDEYEDYEDYEDGYEDEREPTPVPIRKSKWHPQVGLAPSPDVKNAKGHVDTRNRTYKPQPPRKVEIFNDVDYLKRVKSPKFGRHAKIATRTTSATSSRHQDGGYYSVPGSEPVSTSSDRVPRKQRSREGSLHRTTTDKKLEVKYDPAFSKKGYQVKPKDDQEEWKSQIHSLEQERMKLQDDIKKLELSKKALQQTSNSRPLYKYYGSMSTQTVDRNTSADRKLAEVDRQKRLLEAAQKNLLLDKEKSQKKLELEETNYLLELNKVEQARNRVKFLELEQMKTLDEVRAKQADADKNLSKLEEERQRLEEERKRFDMEKEKLSLEGEKKKFEEYKKNFLLGLQMERECLERDRFENYYVPDRFNGEDIRPLRIDPFDD